MSPESVGKHRDDQVVKRAEINRFLILCSAPIFVFWLCTAFVALLARRGVGGDHAILASAASILFVFAPLCVAIGWARLAKSKLDFRDRNLQSGRRYLVIASFLTLPIVVYVIVAFLYVASYYRH